MRQKGAPRQGASARHMSAARMHWAHGSGRTRLARWFSSGALWTCYVAAMPTRTRPRDLSFLPRSSHFLTISFAFVAVVVGACVKEPGYKNGDAGSSGSTGGA